MAVYRANDDGGVGYERNVISVNVSNVIFAICPPR
jgi:hypothetical protein